MNLKSIVLFLTVSLSLWLFLEAKDAGRPSGGAGGGVNRGAARASRGTITTTYSRTPSMSRADLNRTRVPANRPSAPIRNQMNPAEQSPRVQRLSQSDFERKARQTISANPRGNFNQTQINTARQNFNNSFNDRRVSNARVSNQVQTAIRSNRPAYNNFFGSSFYNRYNYHPVWYTPGYNAWVASSWYHVNNLLGWGWGAPVYYGNEGYTTEVPMQYVTQPPAGQAPYHGEWLPLGVFAASKDEQDAPYTNMFVQIAVNKSGTLAGTYYNAASDQIHPLDGFIDKDTQQAVWRVADNVNSPIMTTGIYNLTQDIADVKVRYSTGDEQYWTFVRLNQ